MEYGPTHNPVLWARGMIFAELNISAECLGDPRVDEAPYEVYYKDTVVFSKVRKEDVEMLKDLVALRANRGRPNRFLIA